MRIIGLTGGIGSGKSTIARVFESLGVPVFYADDVAKSIYDQRPDVLEAVIHSFGIDILDDGVLNRQRLSAKVFSNSEELEKLNKIVHPAVAEEWQKWKTKHSKSAYVMREAAILIETGLYRDCDEVILVTAPEELRIKRVLKRDNVSEPEIRKRINNQWSDEKKNSFASLIWPNDGTQLLLPVLLEVHAKWSSQI